MLLDECILSNDNNRDQKKQEITTEMHKLLRNLTRAVHPFRRTPSRDLKKKSVLTLSFPQVIKTEFLLTISILYQAVR